MRNVNYQDFVVPLLRLKKAYHLLGELIEHANRYDESHATALSGISLLLSDGYEKLQELQARMHGQGAN